jgi:disulfide bond formation protein DsbB
MSNDIRNLEHLGIHLDGETEAVDTGSNLGSYGLQAALFVAWVATLGSLHFSEVRGFVPCALCWYQRILMYPIALLISVGIIRQDRHLPFLVLPFSILGMGTASYHYLIQKTTVFGAPTACQAGVPCTLAYINWFGFITIPFLALLAFTLITLFALVAIYREEPVAQTPLMRTMPVLIILVAGLAGYAIMAQTGPVTVSNPGPFVVETIPGGDMTPAGGATAGEEDAEDAENAEPTVDAATLAEGRALYMTNCAPCHGGDGQGVPGLGNSLVGSDFLTQSPQSEVLTMIREGRMPGHPDNTTGMVMPGSGGRPDLTDDQIWAIVQALRNQLPSE